MSYTNDDQAYILYNEYEFSRDIFMQRSCINASVSTWLNDCHNVVAMHLVVLLGDEMLSETVDDSGAITPMGGGGRFERRRRSGMDDITRYSKTTEVKKSSNDESRYSKLSSGDSG